MLEVTAKKRMIADVMESVSCDLHTAASQADADIKTG